MSVASHRPLFPGVRHDAPLIVMVQAYAEYLFVRSRHELPTEQVKERWACSAHADLLRSGVLRYAWATLPRDRRMAWVLRERPAFPHGASPLTRWIASTALNVDFNQDDTMRDISLSSVMTRVFADIDGVNASFGLMMSCPVECRQHDMVLRTLVELIDSSVIVEDIAMSPTAPPSANVIHRLVFHGAAAGSTPSDVVA